MEQAMKRPCLRTISNRHLRRDLSSGNRRMVPKSHSNVDVLANRNQPSHGKKRNQNLLQTKFCTKCLSVLMSSPNTGTMEKN